MARKKTTLDRRECVVQAADSLFNHYGFEKTTMEDISREAGIPRATIYLEFPAGKEDILMASVERYFAYVLQNMRDIARQARTGRLEALKQAILFNILANHNRTTDFQHSPANLIKYCDRVKAEMNSFFQERQAFFTELLQQAALSGEISVEYDCNRLATVVTHGLLAFMPPMNTHFSREEIEADASAFFSLLLYGIAKNHRALTL